MGSRWSKALENYKERINKHGLAYALHFSLFRMLELIGRRVDDHLLPLKSSGYPHTRYMRYRSSDLLNFEQIFTENEFACLNDVPHPELIVDCGAYVGFASLYFLKQFPKAKVLAFEPDDRNFKVSQKNLHPYGKRVTLTRAALWSHQTKMDLLRAQYRDKQAWSTQVREAWDGAETNLVGLSVTDILESSGFETIDILKVDIEASEKVVFSENYEDWIGKVKNIAIELHDAECEKIFFSALSGYRFDLIKSGELTVCKNISKIS